MIRRQPTTISLTAEDLAELEGELEESKLQRELKAQQRNLLRSSAVVANHSSSERPVVPTGGTHESPLGKISPRVPGGETQRPPSESFNGRAEGPSLAGNNPFYTER
ncbi:LAME_0H18250g1_1 [Lachancea meyersii CBS 8951]|uniref:LAME_0H18250g1_1 n=1 Tax=Lachancea meyersii CBS 8951 TaxID=1266667 RepID=A0A1G4KIT8_9SACH|nr:LAME_0H18250g1_1 [Lachancea meyersii CBS 8951]